MSLSIYKHRSGLPRLTKALEKGSVTLGFIGGSITDAKTGTRWPEYVISWFMENYPDVRINIENAAIGATGSDLAVFRAERDLVERNCDIVFVEYAVNDWGTPIEQRKRSREGLVRKLLKEERDLVIVYTYMQEMYKDMIEGRVPNSISEFEELAEHYNIGSVWMGLHALEEVRKGRMKWEEWLPDGLHPEYRGSLSYAQSVIRFLEKELIEAPGSERIAYGTNIVKSLNYNNWENALMFPFEEMTLEGPWSVRRWCHSQWIERVLNTSAPGAKMSFEFEGRGLCLGIDFGKTSSEFRYRLGGKEWKEVKRERPWWVGDMGWYRVECLYDDLQYVNHSFELEVIHGDREECKGTNFNLAFAGILI
jgi:hypothetical protein